MPDPGPGWIGCGESKCKAGSEICMFDELGALGEPAHRCVAPAHKPAWSCETHFDYKACDGAGDCSDGEICCYQSLRIIGPCAGDDDETYACKPAGTGKTPCHTEEICSHSDPGCKRRGSSCVVDALSGVGSCEVRGKSGVVTTCDRGSQCAPDEACFSGRCALNAASWAGDDLPLCTDATDCVGYCEGRPGATCHENRFCECRPVCTSDAACRQLGDYCTALSMNRYGGARVEGLVPFCDKKNKVCDCRE